MKPEKMVGGGRGPAGAAAEPPAEETQSGGVLSGKIGAVLVVGGGLAGMTAALAIVDSGFPICLVEKDEELGGMARRLS
jgi:heterodisulfide reductase subunit A2